MFLAPFFRLAAVSPARQQTFRFVACAHVALFGLTIAVTSLGGAQHGALVLGNVLLVQGIVEGALLIGWRLTQLPKSQALEFLLVSPLRPPLVFIGEAAVGVVRLGFITLTGLPLLILLAAQGALFPEDITTLLLLPYAWGVVAGLGLTIWAFEPLWVRGWGERLATAGVISYLVIGIFAGENLPQWLVFLPPDLCRGFLACFRGLHEYNPFGVMKFAMEQPPALSGPRVACIISAGGLISLTLLLRGAFRLHGHFQEEHYRPVILRGKKPRPQVGDYPLTWWAVKRVTKFSGRINLWLALGFALMYGAHTVFHDAWPPWLGRQVFVIMDSMGGMPVLTTALVLLAAVPAAFQYGIWDSSAQDRCRRLELLLLTNLSGGMYWHASATAAWKRGRGYFGAALVLWSAALCAGQATLAQVLAGLASGVILWGFYFVLGFWAFAKGVQANLLGMGLTLGLPLGAFMLARAGWTFAMGLLPPGSVYLPATEAFAWTWMAGPLIAGVATLVLARVALARCERELRAWYNVHQGTVC